jgi:hypothetical protein
MHRDIMAKSLKIVGSRHEVAFAVDLHQHADLSTRMDVATHDTFGGSAPGLLLSRGLPLFSQDVNGLFYVAIRFNKRVPARGKTSARPFPEILYLLRGYIFPSLSRHEFTQFLFDGFGPNYAGGCGKPLRQSSNELFEVSYFLKSLFGDFLVFIYSRGGRFF